MSKHFRPWNIDQTLLLPPSVQDFVPKDHRAEPSPKTARNSVAKIIRQHLILSIRPRQPIRTSIGRRP